MEPAQIFDRFGPWGLAIILVIFGGRWVIARMERSDQENKALASAAQLRCDADRQSMTAKIDRLEDRIADMYDDTIAKSTAALAANVDAFKRFCEALDRKP